MDGSILTSTKKMLNLQEEDTFFDMDITIAINSILSDLHQLGVGPSQGYEIQDKEAKWSDLGLSVQLTNKVRTYVFLKTRLIFDPPATSFHIDAMKEQIAEHEFRLTVFVDEERLAALSGVEGA